MTYDNTNRGVLGKNKRKEQDSHPDWTGSLNVKGEDFWLNGWLKANGQTGEKFLSLSVKPKDGQRQVESPLAPASQGGRAPGKAPIDLDDDIPFMYEWR
jgi:hypothetical protein